MPPHEDEPRAERTRFSRLSEQLTGLLDPESAFRRGQGLVTGVTQATKDELMRIVSSEVRSFLDKINVADLMQQVVAGLVVDVNMQIRFSKDRGKPAQPEVTKSETQIRTRTEPRRDEPEEEQQDDESSEQARKKEHSRLRDRQERSR